VTRGQRIGLIGAALIVAVLAFVLLSGDDDDADTTPSGTTSAPTLSQEPTGSVPGPGPKPAVETIEVVNGEPQGGVAEITANKDDTVEFKVDSDTAAEVHVHGYDLMKDVEPGQTVTFAFPATITGIFEIELEDAGLPLGSLRVDPR
jgi:hypothetical protein